jgi:hypothetical protein
MSPNRIVAVLTPLVFAPLAGAVAAWIANNIPGAEISQARLREIFIGGALIALAAAAQWLRGWQKYEQRRAEQEQAVELANMGVGGAPAAEPDLTEPAEADELDELEDLDEAPLDEDEELEAVDDDLLADEQLAGPRG